MTDLKISEVFGPVWQGEGRQTGQFCSFVRVFGCNLQCAWCDTPYTWAVSERKAAAHRTGVVYDIQKERSVWTPQEIVAKLRDHRTELVVISGGEPMMQQDGLREVMDLYHKPQYAIETAGTIVPTEELKGLVSQWTVSPKLSGSENALDKRFNEEALIQLRDCWADFKFVITSDQDLEEAQFIQRRIGIRDERMWAMPEGIDAETLISRARELAPKVSDLGWNFTMRQHVLLYDNLRGV